MIAMGFLISVWVGRSLAVSSGLDANRIVDLGFCCLLSGFVGARLLYVLTQWSFFAQEPSAIFKFWEGGLVFYGGPLFAFPAGLWFVRRYKMPVWKTADIILPSLVIAHSMGRLGCLSAGCCYGKPTGTQYGIRLYSELVDPQLRGVLLHPTQLYEAFSLLVLFFGLMWVYRRKKFDGEVALVYFIVYPVIRSIIEIYRGDQIRGFIINNILSTSQFISILIFAAALVCFTVLARRQQEVQK